MEEAPMVTSYKAAHDIEVLTSDFPIPGYGLVPINSFVLKGREPVLVDTGAVVHSEQFMPALRSVIDPAELKWLWLTHTDFDHIGSLSRLLAENPKLRVMTSFLSVGIMGLSSPLPLDRVRLVCPGERVPLGDRTFTAIKPPSFDNPATLGFFDDKSHVLFSADCFGAALQSVPQNAADISERDLRDGQVLWATVDAPWLHRVDKGAFAKQLDEIRRIEPAMILSAHLPAAPGSMTERFINTLTLVPEAKPFIGPDQAAFEQMLRQITEAPQPVAG
jgi:flavorubredoxin